VRKSRFNNEEQIIAILKEAEAGIAPDELCRRHGITRGSLYRWKGRSGCRFHADTPLQRNG
jgi:putative transposase